MNHVHFEWKIFIIDAVLGRRVEVKLFKVEGFVSKFGCSFGDYLDCGAEILKLCVLDLRNIDLRLRCRLLDGRI